MLLGSAVAWPLAARAQQPALPVVGFLNSGLPDVSADRVRAFRQGLSESGFVEGRNVAIEFRWAQNERERLPELAADLVRRRVAVIFAAPGAEEALAAKAATTTIPIIFYGGADPVQTGLVASLNRPGGNVTGLSSMNADLGGKRLGFLHELIPTATRFAVLVNPNAADAEPITRNVQAAASLMGHQVEVFTASTSREIETAFTGLVERRTDALLVTAEPLFGNHRSQILTLATYHRVPTIYYDRAFANAGGLMSYGPSVDDQYRQVGIYTGRILKGEKPADLPVLQPSKFELVINLQTARVFGIAVPATLLARADEVIE
jgi:putative ABC transport system substrate-binding protein